MEIPLFRSEVSEEAIANAAEVLRSGWVGAGPLSEQFEQRLATYLGANDFVAMNSGTSALHLALRLVGLAPGDEVITTALTFVATNHPILYEGATPVFADVQADTGNIDPGAIKRSITPRSRAVMIVHYGGNPCDLSEIYDVAHRHNLAVIEDCAHAIGATYKGKLIGTHGRLHAFSFGPIKNLTAGEGGGLSLSSPEDGAILRRLRSLGVDRTTYQRGWDWDYSITEVGFRYQMSDLNAAIGLAHLRDLDVQTDRRRSIAKTYKGRLEKVAGLGLIRWQPDRSSAHHLFSILVTGRDALIDKLKAAGIQTGVHYRRNDHFRMFTPSELPETERFWTRAISLPMHLRLSEEDIHRICDVIEQGW